jgi:hypothetical protein
VHPWFKIKTCSQKLKIKLHPLSQQTVHRIQKKSYYIPTYYQTPHTQVVTRQHLTARDWVSRVPDIGFTAVRMTLGHFFFQYFELPCQMPFHQCFISFIRYNDLMSDCNTTEFSLTHPIQLK